MENKKLVAETIEKHIKMRNRTRAEIAAAVGEDYKTFCGILNRGDEAIRTPLLLRLANVLDIDLNWLVQLYKGEQSISFLERHQMSRMSDEFRKNELPNITKNMDALIRTSDTVSEVKKVLVAQWPLFYLLDVLLPEEYIIRITVERDRETYYCMPQTAGASRFGRGLGRTFDFYEGNEMLKRLIAERKENMK